MSPIAEWRNYKNLYLLQGSQCPSCKKLFYPKKHLCTCGSRDLQDFRFSGSGKIISFTQVDNTLCIGIIELDEGIRIMGQITDADLQDLSIGVPVKAVFRRMSDNGESGIISYGIKFII